MSKFQLHRCYTHANATHSIYQFKVSRIARSRIARFQVSYAEGARNESFSLGNVKGRDSVARELLCWNTSAHIVLLGAFLGL